MAQKTEPQEPRLPHAGDAPWTWREPAMEGGSPILVFRASLGALVPTVAAGGTTHRPRKTATFDAKAVAGEGDKPEIAPEKLPGSWRKRGLPEGTRRVLPLLLHEFTDLEGFDEKEIRYGSERTSGLMNVKIRLKKKRRGGPDAGGRSLASYPVLKRILPRLVSFGEEPDGYRFAFDGWRPTSVHVLKRVLDTPYRFRLEDLSRFATHGDHLLHALEHVDAPPCLDLETVLYVPGLDSEYPFKFALCTVSSSDSYVIFVNALQRIYEHTETIDSFKDRFFAELKLGFEKFGPACATPEFQEVELRVWTLLSFASSQLQILVGDLVHTMDGPKIRDALRKIRALHRTIDECANLPSGLAAFYRTHFDIPFAKLFEHSLAALDELAKTIGCNLKDRPRDIEYLTEHVTRFRRIEPAAPLEHMESRDALLAAAYAGKEAKPHEHPSWVRRYEEAIFTGTTKFDQRRYGNKPKEGTADEKWDLGEP